MKDPTGGVPYTAGDPILDYAGYAAAPKSYVDDMHGGYRAYLRLAANSNMNFVNDVQSYGRVRNPGVNGQNTGAEFSAGQRALLAGQYPGSQEAYDALTQAASARGGDMRGVYGWNPAWGQWGAWGRAPARVDQIQGQALQQQSNTQPTAQAQTPPVMQVTRTRRTVPGQWITPEQTQEQSFQAQAPRRRAAKPTGVPDYLGTPDALLQTYQQNAMQGRGAGGWA